MHGKGIQKWKDEKGNISSFNGEFVEGKKTGRGQYEDVIILYEGEFVDDVFHGQGKL